MKCDRFYLMKEKIILSKNQVITNCSLDKIHFFLFTFALGDSIIVLEDQGKINCSKDSSNY